jgi:putative NADPH-quinone reductase
MYRRIAVIQGHPDRSERHFCHALAEEYVRGAEDAGHDIQLVDVAKLDFPLLKSQRAWEDETLPPGLRVAQTTLAWAEHWLVIFPLWMGDMPAMLKGFFEQVLRPGFAFGAGARGPFTEKLLKGKSARIVVTMGMPAVIYRWYFRAHSLKSLERNILGFCGVAPIDETLIGTVAEASNAPHEKWLSTLRKLGRDAK